MKQIILGTAGHIDHGKTSLIRAVTGINTDRLKEEQERGITIELGFASLDLPGGQRIGIVDVPGHEKFVKNMVAGASGVDMVAMVIAADEGVMPQTREHMEICTLLGVRHGFVALTKIDMVDEEWMELVQEDIRDFLKGTFLDGASIVPVSAVKEIGLDNFVKEVETLSGQVPGHKDSGLFRLPVDRVFTMKGFGTVITGTLISGAVSVGEAVEIYPTGEKSKVRGVQVHNSSVETARAGQRTAINFQGLEKSAIDRGQVVSTPGALKPSYMVDVSLQYLKSIPRPLKNRTRVRFHSGTSEILGLVILLDRDELAPGETAVAQIRLDEPVSLVRDDHFVIRSYSPVRTVGGGIILNPVPVKHKRFHTEISDGLNRLLDSPPETVIDIQADAAGTRGVSFIDLKLMTSLSDKPLENAIGSLLSNRTLVLVDKEHRDYIHGKHFGELKDQMRVQLERYHADNPLKAGMQKEELKSKYPVWLHPKLFTLILNQMVKENVVAVEEETVRLAGYKISLGADQSDIREKMLTAYRDAKLQPPYFKELPGAFGFDAKTAKAVLQLLHERGDLVKVKEDLYFDADAVSRLKDELIDFLNKNGEISTPQFKDMTGASRKYVIPLIEHFDSTHVTIRIGDIRKLRKSA
ncbi:MAG: selenocysteine-specific translation elongation factor [Pseudomonadota bacterium]